MNSFVLVLIALVTLCALFAALYLFARRIENYGVVDVAWSYAFGALAVFYAVGGPGWTTRRGLIAALALAWSFRLGTHLFIRVSRHHPQEDTRYAQLRRDWSANFASRMFGFFQLQAASVVLLGVVFLLPCLNSVPRVHPLEYAGIALWLIAVAGESLADAQLAAFKRDPSNRGRVCDAGLWHFSRHPNYFFEWLVWVGYFVFALASPWGVLAIVGPASILWLLVKVTGIPMAEEQSLQNRGEAYRRYQQTTSAFIPWFPKRLT